MGITPQQFEQMQGRVAGKSRTPAATVVPRVVETSSVVPELILGIDASLRGTGYGIVRIGKPGASAVAFGRISCPQAWEHSRCLVSIAQTLRQVIQEHRPTVCIMEGFYCAHLQTVLAMGQARGVALATAAEAGLEVYEIAPRKVKQMIVGYGAAQKVAVGKMVQRMLGLEELPGADETDALALALAHAQEHGKFSLRPPKRI